MGDILGHDVNGKPLRAGDRVEMVGLIKRTEYNGTRHNIRGPSPLHDGDVEIDLRIADVEGPVASLYPWDYYDISPTFLRRIDDHEPGDWSEIEKQTGWKPRIEVEA